MYEHSTLTSSKYASSVKSERRDTQSDDFVRRLKRCSYESCCREAGIEFTTMISTGSPADAIVRAAQESNCNMIVMGSRGRNGLRKVFGSIADMVSAHSSVPVVVVGDECVCSNHCGTSSMNVFEFKPVPNLQGDLCAC